MGIVGHPTRPYMRQRDSSRSRRFGPAAGWHLAIELLMIVPPSRRPCSFVIAARGEDLPAMRWVQVTFAMETPGVVAVGNAVYTQLRRDAIVQKMRGGSSTIPTTLLSGQRAVALFLLIVFDIGAAASTFDCDLNTR